MENHTYWKEACPRAEHRNLMIMQLLFRSAVSVQMRMEREDLRVELSIAHRRQERMENQNRYCNMEVVEGIHGFEDALQKTAPAANSRNLTNASLLEATRVRSL